MSRLLVSAAHKSSGKTTIAVGLCAALTAQGLTVQAFKKGPDYIDPMWLAQASGRDCFNLDPYLMAAEAIKACFTRHAAQADISIVEGNKGLYDGLALDGSNSNAALAELLDLPVVLVLDARGMTRGIAPLILGYQAFDPRIRIAGVILNQLGGARHEAKLRAVIEHYTDITVLGAMAQDPRLALVERHLGLMPSQEHANAAQHVQTIGRCIAEQVDLKKILQLAASAAPLPESVCQVPPTAEQVSPRRESPLRIGLARDKAFGFYYPDDLLALQAAGAEIVPFNTLQAACLPDVDGLFIGGGFPEVFMSELQANVALRSNIRTAIEAGLPVYAECGGLMYLARTLRWKAGVFNMVGALPLDVVMHERPVGRGYVELQTTADAPWPVMAQAATPTLRGHEFHYSSLENMAPELKFAYRVVRGHGVDGQRDGIVYRNVLASYAHLRSGAGSDWVNQFVNFVRQHKNAPAVPAAVVTRTLLLNDKPGAAAVKHLAASSGRVYLVGAGPGDPELLTLRAVRLLQQADVIVYDHLVSGAVLDFVSPSAERIYAGKRCNVHTMPQEQINALLVKLALEGKQVVRLKGGDPFIFGRGGEELQALAKHGIAFEVVPGVTAASAVSSYAGIPLTHRDFAQSCLFVTGHLKDGTADLDWPSLVKLHQTVVIYMGLGGLAEICRQMMAHGAVPELPIAVVQDGSLATQKVVVGTLADMPERVARQGLKSPCLTIIGQVVKLHDALAWFKPTITLTTQHNRIMSS